MVISCPRVELYIPKLCSANFVGYMGHPPITTIVNHTPDIDAPSEAFLGLAAIMAAWECAGPCLTAIARGPSDCASGTAHRQIYSLYSVHDANAERPNAARTPHALVPTPTPRPGDRATDMPRVAAVVPFDLPPKRLTYQITTYPW